MNIPTTANSRSVCARITFIIAFAYTIADERTIEIVVDIIYVVGPRVSQ